MFDCSLLTSAFIGSLTFLASFRNRGGGCVLYRDCNCKGSTDSPLLDVDEDDDKEGLIDSLVELSSFSVRMLLSLPKRLGSRSGVKAS